MKKLLFSVIFALGFALTPAWAEGHGGAGTAEAVEKINPRCKQGDGLGCAACKAVRLPNPAPLPENTKEDTNCRDLTLFCGEDGKTYYYTKHFNGQASDEKGQYRDIPYLVDEAGKPVCPKGYAYRIYEKAGVRPNMKAFDLPKAKKK